MPNVPIPSTLRKARNYTARAQFAKFAAGWVLICVLSAGSLARAADLKTLPPRYRDWLQHDVVYIITQEEREAFLRLASDADRDKFIERFWEIRNPNPGAPGNAFRDEHYKRLSYVDQWFGHESGTPGWRTDMGRVYITLGEPKQKAKYLGQANVRPMEIWFYSNVHPALPPFFSVVFYQRDVGDTFRLYSPYMDGPGKLVSSASTENDRVSSFNVIDKSLGREVSRTILTLVPDEPVDLTTATSSLQSDILLANIRNLANTPSNKDLLNERRRILEVVSHRVIVNGGDYLDLLTVPLRDPLGNWNLHYLLRYRKPEDFTITQASDGRYYYNAGVTARIKDSKGKLIYEQHRKLSGYLNENDLDRVKSKIFGYEGVLPLAPGSYNIEFALTNESRMTTFRDNREIVIPSAPVSGLMISDIVPFSDASQVQTELAPFTVAGVKFTPAIGQGIAVVPGQDLKFFYQIWGPPDRKDHTSASLKAEYAYGRMGLHDTKTVLDDIPQAQFDPGGSMVNGKKIPTLNMAGGNYRLSITVADPETRQKAFASFQFRLGEQSSPAAWDISDPELQTEVLRGVLNFNRGLCYEAQGAAEAATKLFRDAFARDSSNESVHAKLVGMYFAEHNYQQIVELYSRSGISAKTDEQTVLRIGESLDKVGDLPRSIQMMESAIALKPDSGPLYLALAGYYQRTGKSQRAAEMERKGRRLIEASQSSS